MAEDTGVSDPKRREHTYKCPQCGCEFTRAEGEPEACKCEQCGSEVNTAETGCACCR